MLKVLNILIGDHDKAYLARGLVGLMVNTVENVEPVGRTSECELVFMDLKEQVHVRVLVEIWNLAVFSYCHLSIFRLCRRRIEAEPKSVLLVVLIADA